MPEDKSILGAFNYSSKLSFENTTKCSCMHYINQKLLCPPLCYIRTNDPNAWLAILLHYLLLNSLLVDNDLQFNSRLKYVVISQFAIPKRILAHRNYM